MATTWTVKYNAVDADYGDLNAACQNASLLDGDSISIQGTWPAADTNAVDISKQVAIYCDSDSKFPGYVPTTQTHYRLEVSNGDHCVTIWDTNISFTGLDVRQCQTGSSDEAFRCSAGGSWTWDDCHIAASALASQQDGIYIGSNITDDQTVTATNCVFQNWGRNGIDPQVGSASRGSRKYYTINANSCTFYKCGRYTSNDQGGAIHARNSDPSEATIIVNVLNCIAVDCGNAYNNDDAFDEKNNSYINYYVHSTLEEGDSTDNFSATDSSITYTNFSQGYEATDLDSPGAGNWVVFNDLTGNGTYADLRLKDNVNNTTHTYTSGYNSQTMPSDDLLGNSRTSPYNYGAFEIVSGTTVSASVTDGIKLSDSLTGTVLVGVTQATVADGVKLSDTPSAILSAIASIVDGLLLSDSSIGLEPGEAPAYTELIPGQDVEVAVLPDGRQVFIVKGGELSAASGLEIALNFTTEVVGAIQASVSDGISLSDSLVAGLNVIASVVDGLLLTDYPSASLKAAGAIVDGILASDYPTSTATVIASVFDGIKAADGQIPQSVLQATASDGTLFTDVLVAAAIAVASSQDGVKLTDYPYTGTAIAGSISSGISISDTTSSDLIAHRQAQDGVKASDTTTADRYVFAQAADGVKFSEALATILSAVAVASDTASLSDSPDPTAQMLVSLADGVLLSDESAWEGITTAVVFDGIQLSDQTESFITALAEAFDGILLSDGPPQITLLVDVADSVALTDSVTAISKLLATVSDQVKISDSTFTVTSQGDVEISFTLLKASVTIRLITREQITIGLVQASISVVLKQAEVLTNLLIDQSSVTVALSVP